MKSQNLATLYSEYPRLLVDSSEKKNASFHNKLVRFISVSWKVSNQKFASLGVGNGRTGRKERARNSPAIAFSTHRFRELSATSKDSSPIYAGAIK